MRFAGDAGFPIVPAKDFDDTNALALVTPDMLQAMTIAWQVLLRPIGSGA
jgi:hypothetical protein